MCQKEKGITSMSVKEIVTSLVDDSMVDTEKIGTCVYFWAFPSKASQNVSVIYCFCCQYNLFLLLLWNVHTGMCSRMCVSIER